MKLKITVDGKLYEVDVEVSEPEQPQPGFFPPPGDARIPAASPASTPFSGTVAKISAQAGQVIQINDVLLILEAMKMETVITAPIAGKVAKINVNVGDAVQQGQVLVEFE